MADEEPRLKQLIQNLEAFNLTIVKKYQEIGVDEMCFPEDLGMQLGPMLSAAYFRKYIKPSYQRLIAAVDSSHTFIHMHSDGDIRQLADDIVDAGVQIINLQDLVNGIDWIASKFRGNVCVDLDIDRQRITPFGTPEEVDSLIQTEINAIATTQGGLLLTYGLYPGIPTENIKALMDALERYAFA